MREFLIPELQKQYLPQLEAVFEMLNNLSEEELRPVKKEDIEEIVRNMESIIKEYAYTEAFEKCEKFCLSFALKCFRSANLEKRLHGLSYVEEAISMAQRRKYRMVWDREESMYYGGAAHMSRTPQVARWMDTSYLVDWIQEN